MKLISSSILHQDILPLYLQSKQQIYRLTSQNQNLQDEINTLKLQIQDLESQSVNVKSYCAKCMDQSLDQSKFETDSKLYQKIFEKNFFEESQNFDANNIEFENFPGKTERVVYNF